ncbi:MAG: hypothetical protein EZS28_015466 [Streblomastix strix]|uniref:Uncharacterized protein n=1 Tax=Streblomastix strix TaxID=222440 RepID=A0A5J4W3C6_9EUKA|nr:MAG: hypothetical protein EZS28_015466 [Streblomastix strix]
MVQGSKKNANRPVAQKRKNAPIKQKSLNSASIRKKLTGSMTGLVENDASQRTARDKQKLTVINPEQERINEKKLKKLKKRVSGTGVKETELEKILDTPDANDGQNVQEQPEQS